MPQHLLNRPQICSALQQMAGECMPYNVGEHGVRIEPRKACQCFSIGAKCWQRQVFLLPTRTGIVRLKMHNVRCLFHSVHVCVDYHTRSGEGEPAVPSALATHSDKSVITRNHADRQAASSDTRSPVAYRLPSGTPCAMLSAAPCRACAQPAHALQPTVFLPVSRSWSLAGCVPCGAQQCHLQDHHPQCLQRKQTCAIAGQQTNLRAMVDLASPSVCNSLSQARTSPLSAAPRAQPRRFRKPVYCSRSRA